MRDSIRQTGDLLAEAYDAHGGPVWAMDLRASNSTLRRWVAAGRADWNDTMAFQPHSFFEFTDAGREWWKAESEEPGHG